MSNQPIKIATLHPSTQLCCKLASIIVHADEMLSADGHAFDRTALQMLLNDQDVQQWIAEMTALGMAPVKR